ncbi:MAG TPA: hypothetical protein VNQ77_20390 [Frankiaceae bacterium]|nr:hypothetical protein [Frankiaceae bacterium]
MLKAVAPVLLALATLATPAVADSDPNECQFVGIVLPDGRKPGVEYCPGS